MAGEIKIKGKDIVTSIKRDSDTEFRVVSCSTGDTFTGTGTATSSTDKCSDGWEDSEITSKGWEISGTGKAIVIDESGVPAPSQASANYLANLWITGESFDIKMANADGTFYRGGRAVITNYSDTAPDDGSAATFSVTYKGLGTPVLEETT